MTECPCKFAAVLQVSCALELIKIARSGDFLARKADVLKHSGCALGSLGEYLEQTPEEPVTAMEAVATATPDTIEGCSAALESVLYAPRADEVAASAAMNPVAVALLQKLIRLLLEKLS